MRRSIAQSLLFIFLSAILLTNPFFVRAADSTAQSATNSTTIDDLQKHIDEKNAELQAIQAQRDALTKTLDEISRSGDSIKKDIQTYNANINSLNLSIKTNSLNIQKLEYEIRSLSGQIGTIGNSIIDRKKAIANLFAELQEKEGEDLFTRILQGKTLSDSIAEMESITTINDALRNNITELKNLRENYATKIDESKKTRITKQIQTNNLVNLQQIAKEQKDQKQQILAQTKSQEQIYAAQLKELDKKQSEISAVIDESEYKLRSTFDPTLLPLKRHGVLDFPIDSPYITQCYGPTKFAARAYRSKSHNGVDFGGPIGTPILAADSGIVDATGNNDRGTSRWSKFQYGKHIVIKHDNNLATLYAHLSKIIVVKGQHVNKGDVIGYLGNTGYAFGPHLHLTVLWAPTIQYKSIPPAAGLVPIGVTIDPVTYLPDLAGIPHASDSDCK